MRALILILCVPISACAVDHKDIGRRPHLTEIGSGMQVSTIAIPPPAVLIEKSVSNTSLWRDKRADLFLDTRAMNIGDVLTVYISINDDASLDNSSRRNRSADRDFDVGLDYDVNVARFAHTGQLDIGTNVDASSSSEGGGSIARSETVNLRVAVVVVEVLPNGNLVISGSQEVRVNFEVRVLNVSGIVRPRDIEGDNAISYDRIAEARISYGGRGRIMEVQQPGLGQQIIDIITPF
ncbi:MAG: flagellar basal body L-ring protein FlgH [Hyphomicrobiales bacterium]|nr:flagellar basal body L-ring protein FlgH [Hyphomicrobiales bacterium]